jgi:hypothetical protein
MSLQSLMKIPRLEAIAQQKQLQITGEPESFIRIRERLFRADEMRGARRFFVLGAGLVPARYQRQGGGKPRPYGKMMGGAHKFICAS